MLSFRTKKEVQTSLHDTDVNLIEFKFVYSRETYGMYVKVDAYKISGEEENEVLELIPAGGSYRKIMEEELEELMTAAMKITEPGASPLDYMDSLVKSGIKIVITTKGLWKSQLSIEDFE